MVNLAKTLNNYIKDNLSGMEIYNDMFPASDKLCIISVHDPATRKTVEYIDGSAEYTSAISYTARYKDAKTVRSKLDSILYLLDGAKITDTDDNLILKVAIGANVQFIGTDDKNNAIYTCSVTVNYKKL